MIEIKYPDCIDKIGIEFEGFYSENLVNLIAIDYDDLINIDNDGSISSEWSNRSSYEMQTIPCNATNLNKILALFDKNFRSRKYRINRTCGLHFHISLKNNAYGAICRPRFYDDMIRLFHDKYRKVYMDRAMGNYCYADYKKSIRYYNYSLKDHFKRQSRDRYHMINYSVEDYENIRQETVEVRIYGGQYATIEGLASCIQDTIELMALHVKKRQQISRKTIVEVKERKQAIDLTEKLQATKRKRYVLTNDQIINPNYVIVPDHTVTAPIEVTENINTSSNSYDLWF